jgi:hypothetical protein
MFFKYLIILIEFTGVDYKNILLRVKEKSNKVQRLSKDSYSIQNHSLTSDDEILARLPKEEFLLGINNSRNVTQGKFNQMANTIIGILKLNVIVCTFKQFVR